MFQKITGWHREVCCKDSWVTLHHGWTVEDTGRLLVFKSSSTGGIDFDGSLSDDAEPQIHQFSPYNSFGPQSIQIIQPEYSPLILIQNQNGDSEFRIAVLIDNPYLDFAKYLKPFCVAVTAVR